MLYLPTCSLHFSKNQPNVECWGNKYHNTWIRSYGIYIYICIKYPFPRCLQRSHPVVEIDQASLLPQAFVQMMRRKGHGGPSSWGAAVRLPYFWWFRNPKANHMEWSWNPVNNGRFYHINHGNFTIPTSSGELAGFLNQQQYLHLLPRKSVDLRKLTAGSCRILRTWPEYKLPRLINVYKL